MNVDLWFIAAGAFALFLQGAIVKTLWSIVAYMKRGEFNTDGDEDTDDEFMKLNPNTGKFTKCVITNYSLKGVKWGFFMDEGYVSKRTDWLTWAAGRENRFPLPKPKKISISSPIKHSTMNKRINNEVK